MLSVVTQAEITYNDELVERGDPRARGQARGRQGVW